MIRDYQAISKTWFPKGQQRIIPTYGKHHGAKLMGVLNYGTGEIYVEESDKYDAGVFLNFLKKIVEKYSGKIIMILDNARIHHAKLLQGFLDENRDRLTLIFLPPYSPNLNMIEELWGWLKNSVINNAFFKTLGEIKVAVRSFLEWVNRYPALAVDRLCLQY